MRSIKSLEKGLQILEIMSNFSDGVRIRDIQENLDEPITNLSLFLNSLIKAGFVTRRSENSRYYISPKVGEIARRSEKSQYAHLKESAIQVMTELRDELNENVLLAVMEGHDMHFIENLSSNRSVQIQQDRDIYYPPHVTAAGKAILAYLGPERQERYLSEALFHQFTEKSLVNPGMLREDLKNIRSQGYAVNRGEFESEIMAIASPIMSDGRVLASIVVQFPAFRYQLEQLREFSERIKQAARSVEFALSHR